MAKRPGAVLMTSEDAFETMTRTERTLLSWSEQIQWALWSLSHGQKEIYFAQNQTTGRLGLRKSFYDIINCNIDNFYIDLNRSQKWFPTEELNSDDLSTQWIHRIVPILSPIYVFLPVLPKFLPECFIITNLRPQHLKILSILPPILIIRWQTVSRYFGKVRWR